MQGFLNWTARNGERLVDGLAGFAAGYLVWTKGYDLPAIPVVHEFVAMGSCVAIGCWAYKGARKSAFFKKD